MALGRAALTGHLPGWGGCLLRFMWRPASNRQRESRAGGTPSETIADFRRLQSGFLTRPL